MRKNDVVGAIRQYRGNISAIARAFQVSRQAIYDYISNKPDLKQLIQDEREAMIDDAESEIYKQLKKGNTAALIFFLKTQGKSRGYVERQEITGKDGNEVTLRVIYDRKDLSNE
jgi:hypothetical protein